MSAIAIKAISIAIGCFFVFFGTLKLAPIFSEELYRSMRKDFIRTFKNFPFNSITGWNPNPHIIRRIYGTIEVVGGLVLASCSGLMQDISNITLICLIFFNLFSIWRVADGFKEASNSIVLCLLLTCRIVIKVQLMQKNDDNELTYDEYIKEDIRRRVTILRKELETMKIVNGTLTENDKHIES